MNEEDKLMRTLEALKHPERFTKAELEALLADGECVRICRDLLDSREAMARLHAKAPDVDAEWNDFKRRNVLSETPRRFVRNVKAFRIGAALLVAASLALLFLLRPTAPSGIVVFEAVRTAQEVSMESKDGIRTLNIPRGMNRQLTLADGTRVWLNADSRLSYPESFEGKERREVSLVGEAYFEVAKDAERPFLVKTTQMETRVLGTRFNVRAYPAEEAQVTLVEGSVEVSDRHRNSLRLSAGEHAGLNTEGKLTSGKAEKAEAARSWTDGVFYFDDTELVEIMRELGRWYNIDILFTDRDIMRSRLHFQAERNGTLDEALELLNGMMRVKARIEDGKVIIGV